jgi:hypothetical protein
MTTASQSTKAHAEQALVDDRFDFIAKYQAVTDLRDLARNTPRVLDTATIVALERLIRSDRFSGVRQSYFLFREAAAVMRDMIRAPQSNGMGSAAMGALVRLIRDTRGNAHRGVAEALGSLPVEIRSPRPHQARCPSPLSTTWRHLLADHAIRPAAAPRYVGRSLVADTTAPDRLLVVKLACRDDSIDDLANEIRWMQALKTPPYAMDCRFHVPAPLTVGGRPVFRIAGLPVALPDRIMQHPQRLAIAFVAHRDYFVYPNDHRVHRRAAREMLDRNAYLMGRLAARGVIHDAPIPLFHNRTQRLRRADQGRYQWFRAGRLDRWLDSCAYPNLGRSGLRDFEHLTVFTGDGRQLYRHIGSHFLSLLLVAGSYFRCQDNARKGIDANGDPVDARDLFDGPMLAAMIQGIFENYYAGFTNTPRAPWLPVDLDRLVERMIAEMGVDRYMTELLRRVDQMEMTDAVFMEFLIQRGFCPTQAAAYRRAERDILITSGPHLGNFNRQISLPELIEAVASMSATCVAGRFLAERRMDVSMLTAS